MLLTKTKIRKIIEKECIGKYKGDFDHAVDDNTLIESVIKLLLKEILINNEKLANYPNYPELSFKYAAQLKRTEGYVGVNKKVALKWVLADDQTSGEKQSVKTIKNFEEFKELANWEQTEFLLVHTYFLLHNYLHINKYPEQVSNELGCKSILLLDALENELFIALNAYCIRMIYYRLCKPLQQATLHDFIKNFLTFVQENLPQMRPDSTICFPCGSTEHASYLNFVRLATPRVLLRIDDLGLGPAGDYHAVIDGQVKPRLLKIIDLDQIDKQEWLCEYLKNLCAVKDSMIFDEAAEAIYGINVKELDLLSFTEKEQKEIDEFTGKYKSLPKQIVNNCPLENYMAGARYRLRKVGTATSIKKTDEIFFWFYYKEIAFSILEHPTNETLSESEKIKKARDTFEEQLVNGENNQSIVKQPHETQALDVPKTYDFFTGRKEYLAQLETALTNHSTVIIAGLPGMGKTQLAIQYANNVKAKNMYDWIIWLDAQKDLMSEYKRLIKELDTDKSVKVEIIQENNVIVKHLYGTLKKALFVIDNVKDYEQVEFALPTTNDYPSLRILITSRSQDWGTLEVINLKEFEEHEALKYLQRALIKKPHLYIENAAEALVSELGRIPLAITQAAAYIFNKDKNMNNYLPLYQQNKKILLEKGCPFKNDRHQENIYVSLHLLCQEIKEKSKLAFELLKQMCLFASNHISLFFIRFSREMSQLNELEIDELISLLKAYSLVEADNIPSLYKMHPLAQEILLFDLNREEKEDLILQFIYIYSMFFADTSLEEDLKDNYNVWAYRVVSYQHALKLIKLAQTGLNQRENINVSIATNLVSLSWGIINYIDCRGLKKDYPLTHSLGAEAVKIYQSLESSEFDEETKQSLELVVNKIKIKVDFLQSRALIEQGKFDQAIPILIKLIEVNKTEIVSKENLLFYLGKAYFIKGSISEAMDYYKKASESDPEAAFELSLIELNQGKFEEAEKLVREFFTNNIKVQGINNRLTVAKAKRNLGYILGSIGKYQESVQLVQEAIEKEEAILATEYNSNTRMSITCLGEILYHQGNYKAALEQFAKAYEIEFELVDDHSDVEYSLQVISAQTLISMSQYSEVISVLGWFLSKSTRSNLESSINENIIYAPFHLLLGRLFSILDIYKDSADNYFTNALTLFSKPSSDAINFNYLETKLHQGEHYIRQNRWKEAEANFNFILEIVPKLHRWRYNPKDKLVALTLRNLALVQYNGYKQIESAFEKLNKALKTQSEAYQTEVNAEILITRRELLKLQLAKAENDNDAINQIAIELTKLIKEQKSVYGIEEHEEIAVSYELLVSCKSQLAVLDEAILDQQTVLSILQKVLFTTKGNYHHRKIFFAKATLYNLYYEKGNVDNSIKIATEIVEEIPKLTLFKANLACLYHIKFLQATKSSKEAENYYQQAEIFFKQVIAGEPTAVNYCDYAVFLFKQQRYPDAIVPLREVLIKADSKDLGYSTIEFIRLDEDLQSALKEQTAQFEPSTHFMANYLLVRIYSALKMPSEAEAAYKALQTMAMEKNEPIYHRMKEIAYKDLQSLTQKLTNNPVTSFSTLSQNSNTSSTSMQQAQSTNVLTNIKP